ncbi:MAG TPA: adenylate/guanylate cyclase domain-containing protein [Xanthomonadales bacterium]|nr:adenylate/guanylate cyclase domain-containing protein [Xanthomonadales bacterium]
MAQSQPMTILFADVSGSTKLFELRGDVIARQLISQVLGALGEVTQRHGGRVIKTIGDEIMCTFPGALNGLLAATDMQKRLAHDVNFVKENLAIRVGLHHGDALLESDGDVYGDAVNTAARMASLAKREQIVTTATTAGVVGTGAAVKTRSLGTARVSGKLLPIEIVDVIWQEDMSNVTTVQRAIRVEDVQKIAGARLSIKYRDRTFELTPTSQPFSLGRDPNSSLQIDAEWVSRNHAAIEYKRGYFMLSDRSTNGTWVKLGEDEELRLHRDEIHLRKTGTISLGQAVAANKEDVLYYQCIG